MRAAELDGPQGAVLRKVAVICGWQLVSIMLTATGYCSQRLAQRGIDAPTAQSFANYALLSLHGIPLLLRRRRRRARRLGKRSREGLAAVETGVDAHAELEAEAAAAADVGRLRPWQWLLLALADVEANYLLVRSYQYTDITSVSLLDAFTVPAVMLFSRVLFRAAYSARQLLAVAICLGGLVVLVVSDTLLRPGNAQPHPAPWLGDLLVLVGATLYAASNVWQERQVRATDGAEWLAHLGAYGALVSAAQCALLERGALRNAAAAARAAAADGTAAELVALEAGFIAALCSMYVLATRLMGAGSSATVMNLSLLTSDFWSVVVGVALLGSRISGWYGLAFALVVGGLVVYHWRPRAATGRPPASMEPFDETPGQSNQPYVCVAD